MDADRVEREAFFLAQDYWGRAALMSRLAVKSARRGDFETAARFMLAARFLVLDAMVMLGGA